MEKVSGSAAVSPFGDEFFSEYGMPMEDTCDTDDKGIGNRLMDSHATRMSSDVPNGRDNSDNVLRIHIDNTALFRDNSTNQGNTIIPVVTQKLRNPQIAVNELTRHSDDMRNIRTREYTLPVPVLGVSTIQDTKPLSAYETRLVPRQDHLSREQSHYIVSTESGVLKEYEASLHDPGNSQNNGRESYAVKSTTTVDEKDVNIEEDDEEIDEKPTENASKRKVMKRGPIAKAIFVRFLLICHNVMTVWRVVTVYDNTLYWLLVLTNVLILAEGAVVIVRRQGIEYTWWCPCFLVYLCSTLPLIWLLQLNQHYALTDQINQSSLANQSPTSSPYISTTDSQPNRTETYLPTLTSVVTSAIPSTASSAATSVNTTLPVTLNATRALSNNVSTSAGQLTLNQTLSTTALPPSNTTSNTTSVLTGNVTTSTETTSTSNQTKTTDSLPNDFKVAFSDSLSDSQIWVIIVEESLVYLLVFCRWMLPRGSVSREFLADLLLEFLAIASDIMELLAIFDDDKVRANLVVTYWIMGVWSASFIQFVPILMQKRRFRHVRNPNVKWMTRACGDKFVEIVVMLMTIFLQDGPFLVLRLYVMIQLRLITYSLVFFVLKNMVTLMLLTYRMTITCYRLPCNRRLRRKSKPKSMKVV